MYWDDARTCPETNKRAAPVEAATACTAVPVEMARPRIAEVATCTDSLAAPLAASRMISVVSAESCAMPVTTNEVPSSDSAAPGRVAVGAADDTCRRLTRMDTCRDKFCEAFLRNRLVRVRYGGAVSAGRIPIGAPKGGITEWNCRPLGTRWAHLWKTPTAYFHRKRAPLSKISPIFRARRFNLNFMKAEAGVGVDGLRRRAAAGTCTSPASPRDRRSQASAAAVARGNRRPQHLRFLLRVAGASESGTARIGALPRSAYVPASTSINNAPSGAGGITRRWRSATRRRTGPRAARRSATAAWPAGR